VGIRGVGYILTPNMGNRPDLSKTLWAADTGCFTTTTPFSLPRYLHWLEDLSRYLGNCLFATAPDRVGDWEETWKLSAPVLPILREIGYRAALVAQDGLRHPEWDTFDALFVGGTTKWKLSEDAYALVVEAKKRGKWAHMGRVNSYRRLRAAAISGYDSADGTFVKFGPDQNIPKVLSWLNALTTQPSFRFLDDDA
jgi:hypothetical protein